MFVGKAGSLPKTRVPKRVCSNLAYKPYTRLERLARNNHSSLLRIGDDYGSKCFMTSGVTIEEQK
jgi:hypothetical protein